MSISTTHPAGPAAPTAQMSRAAARLLTCAGVTFFLGGSLHATDEPEDATLPELLHAMFVSPLWYPAHLLLLTSMCLFAVAFVRLRRENARLRPLLTGLVVVTALATVDMVLHLLAATQDAATARGELTPMLDLHLWLESVTVPMFGVGVATLAVAGAWTRTVGHWLLAPLGVLGGLGYSLAAGSVLVTDLLDPLFPMAAAMAAWATVSGLIGDVQR